MSDKLPKDCTMAERRALYSKHRHAPTTDREARNLERVLWLFREMPRIKPATVLDIGCESGFITRWMVDEPYLKGNGVSHPLVGIDPCEFSIEHAKQLVKRRANPDKAWYQTMGWEEFDFSGPIAGGRAPLPPDFLFDAIVCFEVIEHFLPDEGRRLVDTLHKKLAPGGTTFLCTPSEEGRYGLKNPDQWHLKIYTQEELGKLVKEVTGCIPEFEGGDPDFIMLKWKKGGLGPEEHARCMREEADRIVKWYLRLLKEGAGHTREEVAEAFVRSGTTFIKGPFRMAHFDRVVQQALPTNDELFNCAVRLGVKYVDS